MTKLAVRELIRSLGGNRRVAEARGVTDKAVSQWATADDVPAAHRIAMWRMALERGLPWEPPGAEGLRALLAQPAQAEAAE
jgi:hypothetical protein